MLPSPVSSSIQVIDSSAVENFLESSVITPLAREFTLNLAIEFRSNWCWAVVAEGISRYYNPQSTCCQCYIAKAIFPDNGCCSDLEDCNEPAELDEAMGPDGTGNLAQPRVSRPLLFPEVTFEIGNDRPVGCRETFRNGHFVAIIATTLNTDPALATEKITVADPILGIQDKSYAEFVPFWSDTYYTHKGEKECLSFFPRILKKILRFFKIR